jgi:hypothetical protein
VGAKLRRFHSKEDDQMKKFLVLYMADSAEFEKMMKNSTPEQQKKGMEGWMKWMGDHKTSLVDSGAPLGKTKRVDSKGTSDTKNGIGGYSVVQADSADAATKIIGKDHPHLQMPGAWVEVIEIMQVPGM